MPSIAYAFRKYGRKRLKLSWAERSRSGRCKDVTLRLGRATISTIPGWTDLSAGHEFALPDGSTVKVQWDLAESAPRVLRNGQPLSSATPEPALQRAYQFLFVGAGLGIVYGLSKYLFQFASSQPADSGIPYILSGVVFLVLGFFVRRRSLAALGIAIALFALDTILSLSGGAASAGLGAGRRWLLTPWLVIFRMAIIWQLIQAVRAVRATRKHELASNPSETARLPVENALLRQRFLAHAIDLGILGVAEGVWALVGGLVLWVAGTGQLRRWPAVAWGIVAAMIPAIYLTRAHATSGQTLGKRILGIKVVSIDGSPLTWGKSILRTFGYVLSNMPLGLGWLWAIWDPNRQAGHDKIAGTIVVPASASPEQLRNAVALSSIRRSQRRWLLSLGVLVPLVAAGVLLWTWLRLWEVSGTALWPSPQASPRDLVSLDLSHLGLGAAQAQDARDQETWAGGAYEEGVLVTYAIEGDTVVMLWFLRYETTEAARDDYDAAQVWAEDACELSTAAHLGSRGVIRCQFSDTYEKILWNDHWIMHITALEGTVLPPDDLVDYILVAVAGHWRAIAQTSR